MRKLLRMNTEPNLSISHVQLFAEHIHMKCVLSQRIWNPVLPNVKMHYDDGW